MKMRLTKGNSAGHVVEATPVFDGIPCFSYRLHDREFVVPADWLEPMKTPELSAKYKSVKRLADDGYKPSEIAEILSLPRPTVCRIVMELRKADAA